VTLFHFLLLGLAVLLTWETVKSLLPFRLPSVAHSALVVAMAYGWTFAPEQALSVAAVASAVGVMHHLVGSADDHKASMHLSFKTPGRTKPRRVPDLPR